jgi:hypothetical protein
MEESCRAMVLVTDVTERILENVSYERNCVNKDDVEEGRSRALLLRDSNLTGSGLPLVDNVVGPKFIQPVALRTRKGDISLVSKEGGATSKVKDCERRGVLGFSVSDPVGCCPLVENSVCRSKLVASIDHGKSGKSKRVTRKKSSYLPYNKFHKIHEQLHGKSGAAIKRRANKRCAESEGSDSIQNLEEPSRVIISNMEGISLEVVLSQQTINVSSSSSSQVPCSLTASSGIGDSGLADLLGGSLPLPVNQHNSSALVDKDTGDAHHIIDIQEDIGMKFNGVDNEDVVRSVGMEGRDRELKLKWEQGHGF